MKKYLSILFLAVLASGLSVSCKKDKPALPLVVPDGFVDLGIRNAAGKPLFWAECNLGASNPQDSGKYFFWGDVTGQTPSGRYFDKPFSWDTETFGSEFEKVSQDIACQGGILAPAYDAAARVDASWRIPTSDDVKALAGGCVWIWTDDYNNTGTYGFIVYRAKYDEDRGKADNYGVWKRYDGSTYRSATTVKGTYSLSDTHIFLPAAGLASGTVVSAEDGVFKYGHYWSSTFGKGLISDANKFVFHIYV